MRLNIIASAALFLFITQNIATAADAFKFRHLTTKDGLSRNSVICIFQDSRGFMWFGTEDGLNRYDGYEFKVFRMSESNSNAISHNWIWDIFEDADKNLWIATWQGLTKYDLRTGQFSTFLPDSTNANSISGLRPSSVCSDKDNFIWIATWGGGLNRYDPSTGTFKAFHHDAEKGNSLPDDKVRYVFCDSKNRLWVGTWSGLAVTDKHNNDTINFIRFTHKANDSKSISSNKIKVIHEDSYGRIRIGTIGGGLNMFVEKDSSFVKFTHNDNDPTSISSNDISTIMEDSRHRLWIGTPEDGLNLFDKKNRNFTRINSSADDPDGLMSNNVYSIYEDQTGSLWIGAGGINILPEQNPVFKSFRHDKKNANCISCNNVTCFFEDNKNMIWIGTKGGGINCFDSKKYKFIDLKSLSKPNLKNINAISGSASGDIFFATAGTGLFKTSGSNRYLEQIKNILNPDNTDALRFVNSMCFTDNRFLWLATYDNGLIRYDTRKDTSVIFNSGISFNDSVTSYLLCVIPGSKDDLWIGTWGVGLLHFNRTSFHSGNYLNTPDDPYSLSGNMVYSLLETQKGTKRTIYAGTDNGLSFMNPEEDSKGKFRHLTTAGGLPGNNIMGIVSDNSGNIWISTNNGLACYNTTQNRVRRFDETDNLQIQEFNPGACLKLRNGKLLFGGTRGFILIDPEKIKNDSYRPPIMLTSFKVFNKEYNLDQSLQFAKKVTLSYKQNFFSFEFAALDFLHPSKVNYYYKLNGFDDNWIDAGNRRYVSYTNIPPGEYSFQVRAITGSGLKSSNTLSLYIRIRPPYWQTWWFRSSMGIAIILLLYGIYMLRVQKLLAVEKLRIRIASDLHDDIGSALTKISITSEQIKNSNDNQKIQRLSANIGTMSREIVTAMSDIVWSIDSRNDNLSDLTDRMHDLSYNQLVTKDIKVRFTTSGLEKNKKISVDKRQNIFYIFKEAVNNIVKHSEATEVDISLTNDHDKFIMIISDNGTGFNREKIREGNGLRNMAMRAKRLNANLDISSRNGTKIVFFMNKL